MALCVATTLSYTIPLTLAAPVRAEVAITAQARADDGAWLPYAPPPPARAGLCLVDTGVDLNPDTEPTIVDRIAIDGGTGNDVSPETHGTIMAMMAGAPRNGWGMVGTAPGAIQIVSVRILEPEQTTFPFSAYAAGITACLSIRTQYDIRVINLSLGNPGTPSSQDLTAINNAVREANDYGLAVVAAAGNDDGGPVEYPAADPAVLSVGATDTTTGALCSFSNRGEGLRLTAPGCDLDGTTVNGAPNFNYWQGTSEASDITDASLDALIAYRPDLSYRAAEEDLTHAHEGQLDIAGAFRLAGLGATVAAGEAAEPTQESTIPEQTSDEANQPSIVAPSSTVPPTSSMSLAGVMPLPRARLTRVATSLRLAFIARPSGAQTQVRVLGRYPHSHRSRVLRIITSPQSTLTISSTGVLALTVRYIDPYDIKRDSPWITLHLPAPIKHSPHPGLP